jgi:hypothetical protein
MGYRRAAMERRPQYVRGHWRTSKSGHTYWVEGHSRNGWEPTSNWQLLGLLFMAALILGLALNQ